MRSCPFRARGPTPQKKNELGLHGCVAPMQPNLILFLWGGATRAEALFFWFWKMRDDSYMKSSLTLFASDPSDHRWLPYLPGVPPQSSDSTPQSSARSASRRPPERGVLPQNQPRLSRSW